MMFSPSRVRLIKQSLVLTILLATLLVQSVDAAIDDPTLKWIQTTVDAWQLACRQDLHVPVNPLTWMIFYDEKVSWHINPVLSLLPPHAKLSRFIRFSGRRYVIFELENHGSIWIPGRGPMPIKPQAFTMLYDNGRKPFFIASSPEFVARSAHVEASAAQDLANFLTGVDLHELTHTRQLPQVNPEIERLRAGNEYPESLDDNLIENEFGKNDDFRHMRNDELNHFSAALVASDREAARVEAAKGLQIVQQRREQFFVGHHRHWDQMDDVFLALEGSAMWVEFQSALRFAPQGQSHLDTLRKLSERTNAWSQSEGLGLFLLIDRFRPGWQTQFFGNELPSPFEVLRNALGPDREADSVR